MAETPEWMTGNWNYPTSVRFGVGRIAELAAICKEVGMRHPLLVTDAGLVHTSMVQRAIVQNEASGLPTGIFSDVQPNPVLRNVEEGVQVFREGKHDGVIAFGGGSPLDVGKAIAFMSAQTRPLWDFEDVGDNFRRANLDGIAPIVAIPTTAGTGSEVGRCSVITNEDTYTKKIIFHPKFMPSVALLDPSLTVGMSPRMTAGTGMDALAHNLEAFCAVGYHPLSDGIAVEGIRLIKDSLPVVMAHGSDLTARSNMLAAATMGATAFQKGLGAVHALSHPVGAIFGLHHGLLNGVFMPYVLRFNRPVIEPRIERLAAYLELANPTFEGFLAWLLDLRVIAGIPNSLRELAVDDARFEEMSLMAEVDPPALSNPIPLSARDLVGLYRQAFDGE